MVVSGAGAPAGRGQGVDLVEWGQLQPLMGSDIIYPGGGGKAASC